MNVKRYFAPTAREALRRLKEELGADAIVLSNRSVEGGVEITALPAAELPLAREPAARRSEPAPAKQAAAAPFDHVDEAFTVSLSAGARKPAQLRPEPKAPAPGGAAPRSAAGRPREEDAEPAARPHGAADAGDSAQLLRELASIKGLIEQQLAGFAWTGLAREAPAKTLLLTDLLDAGFSPQLARRLVANLPQGASREQGRDWLKGMLDRSLTTVGADAEIIDRGGIYALVGPTGVGKTTTTAKLAARCVVRHGAQSVALLTTDGYRIGAHEQLRIYGRILGVQVHAVRDATDLRQSLAALSGKHLLLIDTIGMGQRDRMVAEQAAMLTYGGTVERLLLLNATSRGDTLDDVVRAYGGTDLAGAIITKVDEAASLAPCVDALVRHGLPLYYVASGQRVPEDLHLPNRAWLLHRALKELPQASPHRLAGDEAGLLLAAGAARGECSRGVLLG
jgi:flagellar biosynthesis protein FlhF